MKRVLVSVALLAASSAAFAHGSLQGLDHFSGGLLHPLVEPTHLISLVALGLVIGQRGIAAAESTLLAFVIGVVVGLVGAALAWNFDVDLALLAIAAVAGGVVAVSLALPAIACVALAASIGAGIGIGSNPDALGGAAGAAALAGAGIGANLWLICIAAIVGSLRKAWLKILVRVVGSWASASAVLVLALWASGQHGQASEAGSAPAVAARLDTSR